MVQLAYVVEIKEIKLVIQVRDFSLLIDLFEKWLPFNYSFICI